MGGPSNGSAIPMHCQRATNHGPRVRQIRVRNYLTYSTMARPSKPSGNLYLVLKSLNMLTLRNTWFDDGHKYVRWSPDTSSLLKHVKTVLSDQLKPHLSRRCSHIKGHGGVKLSVRYSQRLCNHFGYVARFDVRSYYKSMDHQIILSLLRQYQVTPPVIGIVSEYLSLPDRNKSGKGMVAYHQ